MSSGPAARKLNPRMGSSSWRELTPRSSSTASAPSPQPTSGRIARRRAKSPCRRTTRSAAGSSRSRARASARGSRSTPSRRAPGAPATRAAACPPRPTVASTRRAPGRGRSHSTTSPTITGTWAAPTGPMPVSLVIGGAPVVVRWLAAVAAFTVHPLLRLAAAGFHALFTSLRLTGRGRPSARDTRGTPARRWQRPAAKHPFPRCGTSRCHP